MWAENLNKRITRYWPVTFNSNLGGVGVILRTCWFSLNNSETAKAATLAFCSNILFETFLSNLVFLSCPSLKILGKTQTWLFQISSQSLIKENCHDSRTSADIDMKLEPVSKLDKRNKTTSKKLMTSGQKILTSLLFFQFTANLEQSRS